MTGVQRLPAMKVSRLTVPITNARVAWDTSNFSWDAALFRFPDVVLEELDRTRSLLQQEIELHGACVDNSCLPALVSATHSLRQEFLDGGYGFAILRGLDEGTFTRVEIENIFWRVCTLLGVPMVQKLGNVRFGRVENLRLPPGQVARVS